MNDILCIGDGHTIADDPDLDRFSILGRFIADRQPECIVQIGDFLTYDSISSHNNRKRLTMEGQRLSKELEAGREAYNRLMQGIHDLNNKNRVNRKALYKPDMFWLWGNHEERALIYCEQNPEMEGLVKFKNHFDPEADGWTLVPYRDHAYYSGILFTHVPMNGVNRPVGSKHAVKNIIKEYDCPIVYGHTHRLAMESDGTYGIDGGIRKTSLNIGCYFDHMPEYAVGSAGVRDWWAGVCLLNDVTEEGDYDLETVSLDRLRRIYA